MRWPVVVDLPESTCPITTMFIWSFSLPIAAHCEQAQTRPDQGWIITACQFSAWSDVRYITVHQVWGQKVLLLGLKWPKSNQLKFYVLLIWGLGKNWILCRYWGDMYAYQFICTYANVALFIHAFHVEAQRIKCILFSISYPVGFYIRWLC